MPATPDDVLAGLDPEQRAVSEALRGPICVLAGAGTGKTRAITHRIAHAVASGAVAPRHVLAVTFTRAPRGRCVHASMRSVWAVMPLRCRRAPFTPRRCA